MEPSAADLLSANLARLHAGEEELREKALGMIAADDRLGLHLAVTEAAMDLADILRQFQTADEDLKVVQILGMRTFNAFGASIKLALSGYSQNSALILRDVLETTVCRQNIWRRSRRRLAERGPRPGVDIKRRACGAASAGVRWSSV